MSDINPFRFEGRINRAQYLFYTIGWYLLLTIAGGRTAEALGPGPGDLVLGFVFVFFAIGVASCIVRRLHDIGWRGRWGWYVLVPIANLVLVLALLFRPGTDGPNRFGTRSRRPASTESEEVRRAIEPRRGWQNVHYGETQVQDTATSTQDKGKIE